MNVTPIRSDADLLRDIVEEEFGNFLAMLNCTESECSLDYEVVVSGLKLKFKVEQEKGND